MFQFKYTWLCNVRAGRLQNSYEVIDELIVGTVGHREYF